MTACLNLEVVTSPYYFCFFFSFSSLALSFNSSLSFSSRYFSSSFYCFSCSFFSFSFSFIRRFSSASFCFSCFASSAFCSFSSLACAFY